MDTKQWDEQEHAIWKLLPLHPQPQPFEALSSYLLRLLEANRFASASHLFALLGRTPRGHSFFTSCDYRAELAASLTSLTGCKRGRLHATTFLPLGQAFGWTSHHEVCRFLEACLVSFLRYCPACLSEQSQPYYSLIWRFLVVPSTNACCCTAVGIALRRSHCSRAFLAWVCARSVAKT